MNIENIFARATVEVWRARVNSGESTLPEMEEALKRSSLTENSEDKS